MPEIVNALPPGYALNEYRIDTLLGAGGFGLTYLATDANLNLKVALKEYLPNDFAARGEDSTVQLKASSAAESFKWGLQRFMDEARTLASFRHPNIVRVMRFFEANRTGYMVMEFVEGKPLTEWIELRRPIAQHTLLEFAGPLLDGLEVIHKAGYLHRDVKPANVYIRNDGSPVLLDFGSARQLTGGKRELTAIISPGYAPFEQYHAHGKQGPWTDIYAFGGVLYWMLTGSKPVEAAARVRQDIMPPAAHSDNAARYSAGFLAAIDWALKPHEEERPQNVADFKRALLAPGQPQVERTLPLSTSEATVVVPPRPGSTGNTGFSGIVLDREQVKLMELELARRIGPIAAVVVRNAAKKAVSIVELAEAVAVEIADVKERAAFLEKFVASETAARASRAPVQSVPEMSVSQKFPSEVLHKAETTLAHYIGAIAKVVVRRAAVKARDEAELYLLIADEIKDPVERKNFIRKAVSVSRPR
ncbi:MAG TPA: serine/threonine-protein kinase [Burkholderiales bacterium]|nr:serine/threonine-protein kinase [Burkholderiales bacterium]